MTSFTEQTGDDNPFDGMFDGIDVGDFSVSIFADIDGDGDLDLVVGEHDEVLNYFKSLANVANTYDLIGGGWKDTFVFNANWGADTVRDSADNVDTVQLSASDFTQTTGQAIINDYGKLNDDGNVVLTFEDGITITFEGITDLNALADDITLV